MPIDYSELLSYATGLIADFGRPAVLTPQDGGAPIPVTVALIDYGRAERDGSNINTDDRRAFIAAMPGVPLPDPELHELEIDGDVFRIVATRAVKPAETILYYDCQVRL